jgi:hypothetical protein
MTRESPLQSACRGEIGPQTPEAVAECGVQDATAVAWPPETDEERGQRLMWDRLETAYARKPGTALWYEEGFAELAKQRRVAEMRQREREALERARAEHRPGDAFARASAYIAASPGGVSGDQRNPTAFGVVLRVVRGFALDEHVALDLLASEYAPRCKPSLARRELAGMVRRATRSHSPEWGYLLHRERNA